MEHKQPTNCLNASIIIRPGTNIMSSLAMPNRTIIRVILVPLLILSVPFIAMQYSNEVAWDMFDFLIAGCLLFGACFSIETLIRKTNNMAYKIAISLTVLTSLLLIWVNLAVGIIGNENNPANLMFIVVIAIAVVGSIYARFKPKGMAYTLLAVAITQITVAITTYLMGQGSILLITAVFTVLWLTTAWLFHRCRNSIGT